MYLQVYPEFATFREMRLLEVYCPNRDNGCQETFKYTQMQVGGIHQQHYGCLIQFFCSLVHWLPEIYGASFIFLHYNLRSNTSPNFIPG